MVFLGNVTLANDLITKIVNYKKINTEFNIAFCINDSIKDKSEIKKQRLQDETLDQKLERLTMRISDHDGKWTDKYDSAYLGNLELDDGTFLNKQIFVIKEYEQQVPLSFHYINKNTLNEQKNII